jgi:hypothetical protein
VARAAQGRLQANGEWQDHGDEPAHRRHRGQPLCRATWVVIISGDPEGDHVQEVTVAGLPELWKLAHGSVLIRDAGYVVLVQTIEDDEVVDNEVLINKGPHPDLDSDFELFCEVMPGALGIDS